MCHESPNHSVLDNYQNLKRVKWLVRKKLKWVFVTFRDVWSLTHRYLWEHGEGGLKIRLFRSSQNCTSNCNESHLTFLDNNKYAFKFTKTMEINVFQMRSSRKELIKTGKHKHNLENSQNTYSLTTHKYLKFLSDFHVNRIYI